MSRCKAITKAGAPCNVKQHLVGADGLCAAHRLMEANPSPTKTLHTVREQGFIDTANEHETRPPNGADTGHAGDRANALARLGSSGPPQ